MDSFYGSVVFNEYLTIPWAETRVAGVTGMCEPQLIEQVTGFKPSPRDSNWCVMVKGKTLSLCVVGCQVRSIIRRDDDETSLLVNTEIVEVP